MFSPKDLARITRQEGYDVMPGSLDNVDGLQQAVRTATGKSAWKNEKAFQSAVVEESEVLAVTWPEAGYLHAIPNGAIRTGKGNGPIVVEPGVKGGVPDLMLPVARHGYFGLYMELKILGGVLRPEQVEWAAILTEQGYYVRTVIEVLQDARDLLNWYLSGERTQKINGRSEYRAIQSMAGPPCLDRQHGGWDGRGV